jgi:hypothetical protein
VKGLSAAAIRRRDTRAGADQLARDACFVGRRSDVQRGVAGVHDMADLVEEILLDAVPCRATHETCQRELRCIGEQSQHARLVPPARSPARSS